MTSVTLHHGDNREALRRLIDQGVRVHSVVTDPPYGLTSITKRFGKEGAAPAKFGTDGAFARAGAGFMGSKWDGTGIERDPEFWALVFEILLPGGYVVAFSGSRTGHWQACAMEMAGFVMHPMLGWVFGQGFPKAHNAAMAIDKQLGVEGRRGEYKSGAHADRSTKTRTGGHAVYTRPYMSDPEAMDQQARRYEPADPSAKAWEGWAYGGQALKPALEPIYVGQKPFSEKNGALNLLKHGVGAININGCRVPIDPATDASQLRTMQRGQRTEDQNGQEWGMSKGSADTPTVVRAEGRHPANLLHDGSADVVALFPQTTSGKPGIMRKGINDGACYGAESGAPGTQMTGFGDSGSAARFFNCFPITEADYTELEAAGIICDLSTGSPIFYQGKATKADRAGSKHPTVKPIALMRWLCRLVTPPGGTILDPFAGSGTTGAAARAEGFDCILMEAEDQFAADIRARFSLPAAAANDCAAFDDLLGGAELNDVEALLG